jgi:CheY-like chemotaxis protein
MSSRSGQGQDRRRSTRKRLLKGGVIAFSARHATLPCVVRDLSETGARLQVQNAAAVPDTFELVVELDGLEASGEVVWRRPGEVGIRFLGKPVRVAPRRAQIVDMTGPAGRASLRRSRRDGEEIGDAEPEPMKLARTSARSPALAAPAIQIVVADDDPDDRLLLKEAFEESNFEHPIDFVDNGEELLRYLRGEQPYEGRTLPSLILLDLNMPRMDGRTALRHLKSDAHLRRIPVIVLTTSNAEDDIQRTYELGVSAFISKPNSSQGLAELVTCLNGYWLSVVRLPGVEARAM